MRDVVTEMSFGYDRTRILQGFSLGFEADGQLEKDRQYQRAPDRFVISDGEPSELALARLARKRRATRRRELLFVARFSVGEVQRRHIVKPRRRSAAVIERPVRPYEVKVLGIREASSSFAQKVRNLIEAEAASAVEVDPDVALDRLLESSARTLHLTRSLDSSGRPKKGAYRPWDTLTQAEQWALRDEIVRQRTVIP